MKKLLSLSAALSCLFFLNSCAPKAVVSPQWSYKKNAIQITFEADPQLNLYNGKAHTLQLCIYQLEDPNGFNQLIESEDGLYKLLECVKFDDSVAHFSSLIVSPNDRQTVLLDRAVDAKYIGIAAGYAEIHKHLTTRLLEIPVVVVKEGRMFRKQRVAKPDTLDAVLKLGPYQIESGTGE